MGGGRSTTGDLTEMVMDTAPVSGQDRQTLGTVIHLDDTEDESWDMVGH